MFDYEKFKWNIDPKDDMMIQIQYDGTPLFSIFLGEAMESSNRKSIMAHIAECDMSPWLKKWHDSASDEIMKRLRGK